MLRFTAEEFRRTERLSSSPKDTQQQVGKIRYHEHFNPRSWHMQEAQGQRTGPAGLVAPPVALWAAASGQAPNHVLGLGVDRRVELPAGCSCSHRAQTFSKQDR